MDGSSFNLNPGETIIRIVRRHPINVFPVLAATALVLIGLMVASFNIGLNADAVAKFISPALATSIILILAALMTLVAVIAYVIYRQNRIILTNQNLCQIEQFGLFGRTTSKLHLNDVQDVTGRREGLWATLLNYGDLVVETAGEEENFVFKQAPNPAALASLINKTYHEYCEDEKLKQEQAHL